ncbi:MAG: diaminopimelate decarboxylase [Nitrospirae bacterium CG_4_10_14_0_8_um_filter_41_23]|nr:diaminopimelate decarboxylase [Nitrospirota bacterium]OIP60351.1 MAG: diaminopimelate decarboxylase [Nitrospirae bacterium CG2_30_41_42]PIQ94933.1 MAG: diaminopimelate decarboxylase [Nitrospirae bacterium CG11_big_fil_rev_8_21_14_0_20_41_14]PIV44079.1 MAG: diaminopimelate decarboxylase [Nitrospirae bacterium CG02_land_8_20_14_3_00_41_53]PIW86550.1 MAG: diaminopimelate decarboxylase [Nitrospirae bacterium CG_4_8_14_3_um_filter_41_47]PIY85968.1 MAG: diaminopimelate decarboxylase [Nitrospirae 
MHFFKYRADELYAEEVPVKKLAEKYGTPLYVYSYNTLLRHFKAYTDAFNGHPHIICFAIKSNSNTAILRLFAKNGGGADIVSGGELYVALKAGMKPEKIVYAGVGKTEDEIRFALRSKILMFNVESEDELRGIDRVAGRIKRRAPVALRINPDIDPETHPYIATGLRRHKFGIPIEEALEYYRLASKLKNINVIGIHTHIGSQITRVSPFVDALKRILLLIDKLSIQGVKIDYLDVGGGLGISYRDEEPPVPKDLARNLIPLLNGRKLTLIMEPGRSIAGNAGILVTKTLYLKKAEEKEFIIVDAGMNDLIRPSLYGAYHHLLPVVRKKRDTVLCDVVGPICESSDFLATERELSRVKQGEYLAVMGAGAYGFSMSSNYNSRPRAAEVLVKGRGHFLIRKRETFSDLIRKEKIPAFLK